MKKLIPALCMLLVAACLMGTSTYAWFAANEDVTATGMQVQAASDGGLAIASYTTYSTAPGDSAFGSTAQAVWTNGATAVAPTSFDGTNWWTAEAIKAESSAGQNYKKAIDPSATNDDGSVRDDWTTGNLGSGIFQHTKWQIKSLKAGYTLDLKIDNVKVEGFNTEGSNKDLEKSLRVLVKCGNNYYHFAPLYSQASATEQLFWDGDSAEQNTSLKFGNGVTNNVTIGKVTDTVATDVEVFVYFEGEDTNCKTNNIDINTLATLKVTIVYSAPESSAVANPTT